MKNKPAHEIKIGGIKAAIWLNDGKGNPSHSVSVSRSYKAGEEWHQTTSFRKSHLPRLIEALSKAEQWIALREPTVPAAN